MGIWRAAWTACKLLTSNVFKIMQIKQDADSYSFTFCAIVVKLKKLPLTDL